MTKQRKQARGFYRIIAGRWRGRKLPILDRPGLRPTTDRLRETLFNWLTPTMVDALCLDAFAGSGSLGFEALSRGARHVDFIEQSKDLSNSLQQQAQQLHASGANVHHTDFFSWSSSRHYRIIFLDPPFHQQLLLPAMQKSLGLLSTDGMIYIECERDLDLNSYTDRLNLYISKHKFAGQVQYALLKLQ